MSATGERACPGQAPLRGQAKRFEAPDDERAVSSGRLGELELRQALAQRVQRRLELEARERRADADVDAAAELEVLGRVRAPHVELVRPLEDARVAVRGAEEQRDLAAARDRRVADREAVREH